MDQRAWKCLVFAFGLGGLVSARTLDARAEGPLGEDGERILTSAYAVDLSQSVVLGGIRATGLGGAYVAIAEGVAGNLYNPAAPAVRSAYSFQHLDYDFGLGATFPGSASRRDFFNSGRAGTEIGSPPREGLSFVFLTGAANVQHGAWGGGVAFDYQTYGLDTASSTMGIPGDSLRARFAVTHVQLARSFGDLALGVGPRITGLTILREQEPIFETTGSALEFGLLYRPTERPFRIGAAARSQVQNDSRRLDEVERAGTDTVIQDPSGGGTLYLPDRLALPWELAAGAALQLGRPLNPRWTSPTAVLADLRRTLAWRRAERDRWARAQLAAAVARGEDVEAARAAVRAQVELEHQLDAEHFAREAERVDRELRRRFAALTRRYLLVSAAARVAGPVDTAVGVESFLERTVQRSGAEATFTPHLGVEAEVIPRWAQLRAGTYYEPTRFTSPGTAPRWHGTGGADLRLLPWTVFGLFREGTTWRATGSIDVAARYMSWGAAVGVWH